MKLWSLIILLLLPMAAGAHTTHLTNASSYPYSILHSAQTAGGDTIIFDEAITTNNGILSFATTGGNCHDWVVDFGPFVHQFGANGGLNENGVIIANSRTASPYTHDIKIRRGTIKQAVVGSSSCDAATLDGSTCIVISGNRITLDTVNLIAGGYRGNCVYSDNSYSSGPIPHGASYQHTIHGGHWDSWTRCYDSRMNFTSTLLYYKANFDSNYVNDSGWTYNLKIDGLVIDSAPHAAMRVAFANPGWGVVFDIQNCNINVDGINDDPVQTSANDYGAELTRVGDGSMFKHNTITSGTARQGGRGIHVASRWSDRSGYFYLDSNTVTVWCGPDIDYTEFSSGAASQGIQWESSPVRIHCVGNNIHAYADTLDATAYMAGIAMPFMYNQASNSDTVYNIIEGNHFHAITGLGGLAFGFMLSGADVADRTSSIKNNHIESNNTIIQACYGQAAAYGLLLNADTLVAGSTPVDFKTFWIGEAGNDQCPYWIARDCMYSGGAADDDITWAPGGVLNLTRQYTMTIHVKDGANTPVEGAIVWGINAYSQRTNFTNTDASGNASAVFTTGYYQRGGPDSTGYNTMTFYAAYGDTVSTAHSLVWNAKADTLVMPGGPPPPAPTGDKVKFKK